MQIIRGILLRFFYFSKENECFFNVNFIIENNVLEGFIIRILHINFARFFFVCIFLHTFRNLFFKSFSKISVWYSGVSLMLILILVRFVGYVLPWGQISFWGARVITRFLRVFPYIGKHLVFEIWRGFSVGQNIISFFFSVHYLLPLIIIIFIIIHIILLHLNLSSNKIFTRKRNIKKPFNRILLQQDFINFIIIMLFSEIIISLPFIFDDIENSKLRNPIMSPAHIKPEWYFLFAYAILRSVPNKLGGVIAIVISVLFFFFFIIKKSKSLRFTYKLSFFFFIINCFLLTWIGGKGVEDPYILIGQILLFFYFLFLFI